MKISIATIASDHNINTDVNNLVNSKLRKSIIIVLLLLQIIVIIITNDNH